MSNVVQADLAQPQSYTTVVTSPFNVFFTKQNNPNNKQSTNKIDKLRVLINQYYQNFPADEFQELLGTFFLASRVSTEKNSGFNAAPLTGNQFLNQLQNIPLTNAFKLLAQSIHELDQWGQIQQITNPEAGTIIQALAKNLKFFANQLAQSMNNLDHVLQKETDASIPTIQLRFVKTLHSQDTILLNIESLDWAGVSAKLVMALLTVGLAMPARSAPVYSQAKIPMLFFYRDKTNFEQEVVPENHERETMFFGME